MKPIDYRKIQSTRRKTLFPLSPREVRDHRAGIAANYRKLGFSFYAIRQILKCSPDEARNLVARAKRIVNLKGKES